MATLSKPVVAFVLPAHVHAWMFRPQDLEKLAEVATLIGPIEAEDRAALKGGLAQAVAVIAGWGSPLFDDELLSLAPNLRLLAYSAGTLKGIVTDAVYDRGIRVTTAAGDNAAPVASFTVGMMATMLKQVPWLVRLAVAPDPAELAARLAQCRELQDMTIGLIGASRVGRAVIGLLHSYPRLAIHVYDPYLSAAEADALGVISVSLEQACGCEVVSLHAPASPRRGI